jgi:2-iminobutanoate/2-iminopropanoate deaminase
MSKSSVTSDRIAAPVGPFSPAVRAGEWLYLSGQVAQDPATGRLVEGDVARQAAQILANVGALLDAAGRTFADVVKVSVFLTDMRDFQALNAVYARHFAEPYPARTTVAVAALPLGALVELELVARCGERPRESRQGSGTNVIEEVA